MNDSNDSTASKPAKPRLYPLTWDDVDARKKQTPGQTHPGKGTSAHPLSNLRRVETDPAAPAGGGLPDRLSREDFRTLVKMTLLYHLRHPLRTIWRFRSAVLLLLGISVGLLGFGEAALCILLVFLLNWIITGILSLIPALAEVVDVACNFKTRMEEMKKLPLIRRMHDFNMSAKRCVLVPMVLFIVVVMVNAFCFEAYGERRAEEILTELRQESTQSSKAYDYWYYGHSSEIVLQERAARRAKREVSDKVVICPMVMGSLFAGWMIVILPCMCWFREGSPAENRYGAVPGEDEMVHAIKELLKK